MPEPPHTESFDALGVTLAKLAHYSLCHNDACTHKSPDAHICVPVSLTAAGFKRSIRRVLSHGSYELCTFGTPPYLWCDESDRIK